jgi:hypothetical protein
MFIFKFMFYIQFVHLQDKHLSSEKIIKFRARTGKKFKNLLLGLLFYYNILL